MLHAYGPRHSFDMYMLKECLDDVKYAFIVLCIAGLHFKIYIVAELKILPRTLKFVYVLGNMWEIKFQERSSKNHVIHKVNFMAITKVNRLMLPNILQSEHELHNLESL